MTQTKPAIRKNVGYTHQTQHANVIKDKDTAFHLNTRTRVEARLTNDLTKKGGSLAAIAGASAGGEIGKHQDTKNGSAVRQTVALDMGVKAGAEIKSPQSTSSDAFVGTEGHVRMRAEGEFGNLDAGTFKAQTTANLQAGANLQARSTKDEKGSRRGLTAELFAGVTSEIGIGGTLGGAAEANGAIRAGFGEGARFEGDLSLRSDELGFSVDATVAPLGIAVGGHLDAKFNPEKIGAVATELWNDAMGLLPEL